MRRVEGSRNDSVAFLQFVTVNLLKSQGNVVLNNSLQFHVALTDGDPV